MYGGGARVRFDALSVKDIDGKDMGVTGEEIMTTREGMFMHTRGGVGENGGLGGVIPVSQLHVEYYLV